MSLCNTLCIHYAYTLPDPLLVDEVTLTSLWVSSTADNTVHTCTTPSSSPTLTTVTLLDTFTSDKNRKHFQYVTRSLLNQPSLSMMVTVISVLMKRTVGPCSVDNRTVKDWLPSNARSSRIEMLLHTVVLLDPPGEKIVVTTAT